MWSVEDSPFAPLARDCSLSEQAGRGLDEMTLRGLLESPLFGARLPDQGRRSKRLGRCSFGL